MKTIQQQQQQKTNYIKWHSACEKCSGTIMPQTIMKYRVWSEL